MTEVTEVRPAARRRRPLALWLAAPAALAVAAAAFFAVRALSNGAGGGSGVGTIAVGPARSAAPALFVGARARDTLVGLRVPPGGPVDVTVVPGDQSAVSASQVSIRAGGSRAPVRSCGGSCFRFDAPAALHRPLDLTVTLRRSGKAPAAVTIRLPRRLPPSGDELMRAVDARMARVRAFRVDETLSSGIASIRATFRFAAPGRMRYAVSDGARAVVVGLRRWDSQDGGPWKKSASPGIHVPSYMWDGAGDARLVGSTRLDGRPVRTLAAFRPSRDFPAWFRLYVTRDHRVVRADMVAPAHFMRDRLSAFDRPVEIVPPVSGAKPTVWEQMRPVGRGPLYQPGVAARAVAGGHRVAGLTCSTKPGPAYGAHLELFANDRVVIVPAGIGLAAPLRRKGPYVRGGRCAYAVRTVEPTGVLHVRRGARVTLGQLFRLWGQPLTRRRLAGFAARGGGVRVFVDGRRWRGAPGAVPLRRHAQIVLEVNGYVPPHARYRFPPGL